jgi:hypothetical protein
MGGEGLLARLRCWHGLEGSFDETLQVPGALESANDRS